MHRRIPNCASIRDAGDAQVRALRPEVHPGASVHPKLFGMHPCNKIKWMRTEHGRNGHQVIKVKGVLIAPRSGRTRVMIHHMGKQITAKKRPGRSAARADWKFMGAEVPPDVYKAAVDESRENGVPQAVVIRWALESYLHERLDK